MIKAVIVILLLFPLLTGCGFTLFEYSSSVDPIAAEQYADAYTLWLSLQKPIGEDTGTGMINVPFVGNVNPIGILQTILSASDAIQQSKEIELGTLGDPASMSVLYSHTPLSVRVHKKLFAIDLSRNKKAQD